MTNELSSQRGLSVKRLVLVAVVLSLLVATGAYADAAHSYIGTYEDDLQHCLKWANSIYHADAQDSEAPDGFEDGWAYYSGYFEAESQTSKAVTIVGPYGTAIHCEGKHFKNPGDIQTRFYVLKNADPVTGASAICWDSGWRSNDTPSTWQIEHVKPAPGRKALCGDGHYKIQSYHRYLDNGAWKPTYTPCGKNQEPTGNPPSCLKGHLTRSWHLFPKWECLDPVFGCDVSDPP